MTDKAPSDVGAKLTHVDDQGAARMVDVSAKDVSARTATASGRVVVSQEVTQLLRAGQIPKGDALAVARIAGIQAAKKTPDLIPLCHPIAIHGVDVDVSVGDGAVQIVATVRTADRTGVEMEALTAVSVAGLALIDMVKAVDPRAALTDVRVEEKLGERLDIGAVTDVPTIVVVTVSTRAAAGEYTDRSGPAAVAALRALGYEVPDAVVVADGQPVLAALTDAIDAGADVILTTGGTGLAPDDVTPDITRQVIDREVPGVAEAIREFGRETGVGTASLSRGICGVSGSTFIVNLPGSTGGVRDGIAVLAPLFGHVLDQLAGGDH